MVRGGYNGKILRVDLTSGRTNGESLPDETILRKYVGCFGLGLWYLIKELPTGVHPLEPENPLIFMNGPLVGTGAPCSNNLTITTLNGDTGFTAGRSHSHSWFGVFLARAGYDGIIITGASEKWLYLWIDDDNIELRDARKFLGKDTHETEDLIKQDIGVPAKVGGAKGVSVAAIGPAGENLCAGSSIMNDKNHGFCHSGVGQIMGSKRLKAIAIRGTGQVPVANREKLQQINREWLKKINSESLLSFADKKPLPMHDFGPVKMVTGLVVKNYQANDLPGFGDRMSQQKITSRGCPHCPIPCAYDAEPIEGLYKGYVATLSGGGENVEGSSAVLGAGGTDPGEAWYLTDLNDRLGFETSSVGCSMAVAFEAYEKGLLTKTDTDGLELKWGDVKVIETLLRRIAHKEGRFAKMLADGPKIAAERVGLPDAALHIKGSGMNLHDWRRTWGVFLGQITGPGSGWPAPAADGFVPDPDAGYPERTDPLSPFGKGVEVAKTAPNKQWHDCYGVCWMGAAWGLTNIADLSASAIAATVGWDDFTGEEAKSIGLRVATLERIFNIKHGLTAEDDINVSRRLTEPAPADAGPAAGKSIGPYLEGWVRDYYEEMGWDRKTGKPRRSTLKKLQLEDYTDLLWG